jgi:hypothetical protein
LLPLLSDAQKADNDKHFFPLFPPKPWSDDIASRLESGLAELVTVECPSYPEVKEGVMLKEGFVSRIEMDTKLSEMDTKLSEMEHNMAVMEHRMDYRMNRSRELNAAQMSYMQELNAAEMSYMQQLRAHDRAQMIHMQQQRALDRVEIRAEMRATMRDGHQAL